MEKKQKVYYKTMMMKNKKIKIKKEFKKSNKV